MSKKQILDLLPIDGTERRMKDIIKEAESKGIAGILIQREFDAKRHNSLAAKGFIERRQESQKKVFYRRREGVRIEYLINTFMQEIEETLKKIPEERKKIERKLIDGSTDRKMGRIAAKVFQNDPEYLRSIGISDEEIKERAEHDLKSWIISALVRKVFKLFKDNTSLKNLPEDEEYYIGVFDNEGIHLVPRSVVDAKLGIKRR